MTRPSLTFQIGKGNRRGVDMRVVFVTCGPGQAEALLRELLKERLVACGNIVKGVRSLYWWKGEICEDSEEILFMETAQERVDALLIRVREFHEA